MNGALLAFGGNRGANVALMVEVLAAGFNGANWSLDAPPFGVGSRGSGHRHDGDRDGATADRS